MTSKSLFFNLMKEDLKRRLWAIALTVLTFFFAYPVTAAVLISRKLDNISAELDAAYRMSIANQYCAINYTQWLSERGLSSFLIGALAVIMAFSSFNYLFSSKKTNFYHSLPVRREKLFLVSAANSLLIFAVPKLIMSVIGALLIMINTGHAFVFGSLLSGFAVHMAFFFLCYMASAAALMLTGNLFIGLLGTGVFYFYGPALSTLVYTLFSEFFDTFLDTGKLGGLNMRTSPFFWCFDLDKSIPVYMKGIIAVIAGLIFMAISLWLYKLRPSEAAGKAMAFEKTKTPIKFLIAVPMAVGSAAMMHVIFHKDGWMIFGLVVGLVITCCLMEIIYSFNFRRLFANKYHILLAGALSVMILAVFRFDLSGYDSYFPNLDKVESAGIFCDSLESSRYELTQKASLETDRWNGSYYVTTSNDDDTTSLIKTMEISDKEVISTVAQKGIGGARIKYNDQTNYTYRTVYVAYHMNSGKDVFRRYSIPSDPVIDEALGRVHDSEAFKTAVYPVFSENKDNIVGINYRTIAGVFNLPEKDTEKIGEIFETYCEEFMELKADTRKRETPKLNLQFKTAEFQEMADKIKAQKSGYLDEFNYMLYYPVYPSFTKTLALLKTYGVDTDEAIPAEDISDIQLLDYRSYENGEYMLGDEWHHNEVITDREMIKEIMENSTTAELPYNNCMRPVYNGVMAYVHVPSNLRETVKETEEASESRRTAAESVVDHSTAEDGLTKEYAMNFASDSIPDCVKKLYDLQQEDITLDSANR